MNFKCQPSYADAVHKIQTLPNYMSNAIEYVYINLCKTKKNMGWFPIDEALSKLFFLALRKSSHKTNIPFRQ